jgi:hypothetical protein
VGRRGCLSVWVERTGELSVYDDPRPPVPVGVQSHTQRCRTREGGWRIRWGAGAPSTIASFSPWTRVNNCTRRRGADDVEQLLEPFEGRDARRPHPMSKGHLAPDQKPPPTPPARVAPVAVQPTLDPSQPASARLPGWNLWKWWPTRATDT